MNINTEELKHASQKLITELLRLKPDERMLIYTDRGSCEFTAKSIQECAQKTGAQVEIFRFDDKLSLPEMADVLTGKIEKGNYNVICELSEKYFYQTSAYGVAKKMGCRGYALAGFDHEAFIRCIGKVDHDLLFKFGEALRAELSKAHTIRVQSREGTSLEMKMSVNPVQALFRKVKGKFSGAYRQTSGTVFPQAGRISEQDNISFPGGQLAFNGIRDTIEGTAVIDGYMWPPEEIGPVQEPIVLRIKKGQVVDIDDTSLEGKLLTQWLEGKSKNVMHFCLGFNPGAKWSGKVMEVERVFGSLSIGITPYPHHTDGIMKNPVIYLDEKVFLKDGKFENGNLSELQRQLFKQMF